MGILAKIIGAIMAGTGFVLLTLGMDSSMGAFSFVFFIAGIFTMSMGFALLTAGRQQKVEKPPPPTVTEIRCDNPECTFKEIRDFEKGDYILKKIDNTCPKCAGSEGMTIFGIYVVREEPEDKDTF